MYISNINDAKTHLSQLIRRALAGDEVIIAKANEPLVKLTPIQSDVSPRQGGFWAGQVRIVGDWNDADEEIVEMFESSEIFPREDS